MSEFVYDLPEGWEDETVTLPSGEVVPRYGRLRVRGFEHMGDEAPLRTDGALYDMRNPTRIIMPTNVTRKTIIKVKPAATSIKTVTVIQVIDMLPGKGIYGDVGRL